MPPPFVLFEVDSRERASVSREATATRRHHLENSVGYSIAASLHGPDYGTAILFGNPAVFRLREDPWLCDPASQRVCRFDGNNPIIASPSGDNRRHNNPGTASGASRLHGGFWGAVAIAV